MDIGKWLTGYWGKEETTPLPPLVEELSIASFVMPPCPVSFEPTILRFRMRYLIEKLKNVSSYDSPTSEVDRTKYFRDLHKEAATGGDSLYGAISSEVDGKYVLTLDCDGTDEMLAVCNILKSYHGLNYAVVVSSPNHYWVIADKVGTVSELLDIMDIMPGVDPRYVDCIRNKRIVVLRGFPRDCMPIFPDSAEFTNESAAKWYSEFRDVWHSEEMKHILRLKQLYKAIKEKKVASLAASPSFAV